MQQELFTDGGWYHGGHHHKPPHCYGYEKIEAVSVCIGYSDFLEVVIAANIGCFDRWIIVTSPHDEATREVCRRYSIQCLLTEDHHRDGEFNKGRVVERALQHLSSDGWRVHIDSDIVLPHNFRNIIKTSHLDPSFIYGADRVMVKNRSQWEKLRFSGWNSNDFHCRVNFPKGVDMGHRWAEKDGYCPIGYFQMWHSSEDQYKGARIKPYPISHNDACRTDVQFALQWDRRHRAVIPELIVVHLESEPSSLGANWNGRKTKKF